MILLAFLFGWIIFWWTAVDDDHASVVDDAERDASSTADSTTVL